MTASIEPLTTPTTQHTPRSTETLPDIASEVIALLRAAGETVGVAESLTAGGVMAALTSVPGASAAFRGGVVSYATELKRALLGVDAGLIAREGVIHADVAAQMAEGARRVTSTSTEDLPGGNHPAATASSSHANDAVLACSSNITALPPLPYGGTATTWGVGTTGVAGPDMQDGKPVGTVYIGIASPRGSRAWGPFMFPGPRERVREATVLEALARLREALIAAREEEAL